MKILFLQKRLLFPHNTGGKIRTLNVLRNLARWHQVTYVCNLLEEEKPFLDDMQAIGVRVKSVPWTEPPRRSLRFAVSALANLVSPRPFSADKDYDPRLRRLVETEVGTGNYDLLICDFVQMARNCLDIRIAKLLFQHNVEAEVFERLAKRSDGLFAKYLSRQAARMRRFEGNAGMDFDRVVAVSERDKDIFRKYYRWNHVDVIDTAVDTEYFTPVENSPRRQGVVFVGSMDWPPNVDGVKHFIANIWPKVRSKHSQATFNIVGRHPPKEIKLLDGFNGISVTGTVPDVRPFLSSAAVGVVPVYSGGGTRLKIFEYMSMKLPILSTSLGAEGLPVRAGEHLVIRDQDEDFANELVDLLKNESRRLLISEAAHALVHHRFTAEKIARQFECCCERAVSSWREKNA